ncbi:cobyric acid synthase [Clostridia bacterium]|nr:cobyric acid synthase [Clostridia bacterium]
MAKAIMICGTMSNAGKSILTAALCRIFKQDGYKTAPFKSQNMALNSYITRDGLEMGRAQVTQAEAAGIEPDVRMNPVLLKPTSDSSSQVILCGEVLDTVSASKYYASRSTLKPKIKAAYESLAADFDIIVIEGAGSPAELNLAKDDFVNIGMAKMAKAPVLLAGDIDRGGIFSQLFGTIKLLPPEDTTMVKATIVNKFRGDMSLFAEGVRILEDICGIPCAGVVPMLNVDIDDEDSVSERLNRRKTDAILDIAVIGMPHISNFTDFTALQATPGIGLRYVGNTSDLGIPNLVILPGTKNTISDLLSLRECGLEAAIKQLAARGTAIIGICGGYQMMGERITDISGVEGEAGRTTIGMGLLPVNTDFENDKRRTRISATALEVEGVLSLLSGKPIEGYEIHMGISRLADGARALLRFSDGTLDGCQAGNIYGTYLHGFFDSSECRNALFSALASAKGESLSSVSFDYRKYKERQYDLLADGVRSALDMELVYRILDTGV